MSTQKHIVCNAVALNCGCLELKQHLQAEARAWLHFTRSAWTSGLSPPNFPTSVGVPAIAAAVCHANAKFMPPHARALRCKPTATYCCCPGGHRCRWQDQLPRIPANDARVCQQPDSTQRAAPARRRAQQQCICRAPRAPTAWCALQAGRHSSRCASRWQRTGSWTQTGVTLAVACWPCAQRICSAATTTTISCFQKPQSTTKATRMHHHTRYIRNIS